MARPVFQYANAINKRRSENSKSDSREHACLARQLKSKNLTHKIQDQRPQSIDQNLARNIATPKTFTADQQTAPPAE
jgi:hypothetical protein